MLFGLQKLNSDSPKVRDLLSLLLNVVNICKERFRARSLGTALYGLKGMSSEYDSVRALLFVLSGKVAACKEKLDAQAVSMMLYGLQGMNSEYDEVRLMLAVLAEKMKDCEEKLNGQAVGNALYGLQGMNSEYLEVRSLLVVLTDKVMACDEPFTAQQLGMALYGLRSMSSEHSEVRSLLVVLADKVVDHQQQFTDQEFVLVLHGLQGMSGRYPEVEKLLDALVGKMGSFQALKLKARVARTTHSYESNEYGGGNAAHVNEKGNETLSSSKDSDTPFLFASTNDNPTQAQVDAFFRKNVDPSREEVISILQRAVKWKKKKSVDVLTSDKLLIVRSSLQLMLPRLSKPQLRHATIGTLECLQVISPTDMEESGTWHSFI